MSVNVFISADIEGCTGLVSWKTCGRSGPDHPDFAFARRMMTHDVNAAIRGARSAGASRIAIKDSHGTSRNLFIDELDPGVELITGTGAHGDGMMTGVGEGFDVAMLIGYHAMAGCASGVMEHTITGGVHRLEICGVPAGEITLSALAASLYGVPVVTVSSDDAGCAEAQTVLPGVATATVKFGYGRYMARCLHPAETAPLIFEAAAKGVQLNRPAWSPPQGADLDLYIEFNRQEHADYALRMPGTTREGAYGVRYLAPNLEVLHRAARMLMALATLGEQG